MYNSVEISRTMNHVLLHIISTLKQNNTNSTIRHTERLLDDLIPALETDVEITCKDGKISANSHLLKLRSTVFARMLNGGFSESGGQIALPEDAIEDVRDILEYIYYARIPPLILKPFDISQIKKYDNLLDLAARFDLMELVYEIGAQRIRGLHPQLDRLISVHFDWTDDIVLSGGNDFIEILQEALAKRFKTEIQYSFKRIDSSCDYVALSYSGRGLGHIYTFKKPIPEELKRLARRVEAQKRA